MRTSLTRQAGLGLLGWLIVLAIASFAFTCFFKLGPVYLDYWQVKNSIEDVLANPTSATLSKHELIALIEKHLDVSRIEAIKARDIRLIEENGTRTLDASYEKRVPLIANIDVVAKFDKLVYPLTSTKTR
jgi:hypothetical protein